MSKKQAWRIYQLGYDQIDYKLNLTGRRKDHMGGPWGDKTYLESSYKVLWLFTFKEWVPVGQIQYFEPKEVIISG